MEALNFLRGDFDDRKSSPEAQILAKLKQKLQAQRDLFLCGLDLRKIRPGNIDVCEKELRSIVSEIQRFRCETCSDDLLYSVDGLQSKINMAIDNLYVASDILTKQIEKENINIKEREKLYQHLRECPKHLTEALKYFII